MTLHNTFCPLWPLYPRFDMPPHNTPLALYEITILPHTLTYITILSSHAGHPRLPLVPTRIPYCTYHQKMIHLHVISVATPPVMVHLPSCSTLTCKLFNVASFNAFDNGHNSELMWFIILTNDILRNSGAPRDRASRRISFTVRYPHYPFPSHQLLHRTIWIALNSWIHRIPRSRLSCTATADDMVQC